VGPILAGTVLVAFGAAGCFGLNSLTFVAVIISLLMMRLTPHKKREIGDTTSSLWEGFRYIARTPSVLRIILMVGTGSLMLWSVATLYPVFATRFHEGAKGFSQMMTATGIGAASGGVLIATFGERTSRRHLIYGGAALFALTLILVTLASTYIVLLCCLMFGGLFMMMLGVNANTRIQQEVPNRLRGRVMAVYSLVFGGLMPLGGLEIGFLAQHLGAVDAVRINASIALVVCASLFTWSELSLPSRQK
jgi:MFS family permease